LKLVTFCQNNLERRLGGVCSDGAHLVDLNAAGITQDLTALITSGEAVRKEAAHIINSSADMILLNEVTLLAPIATPARNIICVGKNYSEHAAEFQGSGFDSANKSGDDIPEHPIMFSKAGSTIIGPEDPIPASSDPLDSTDYEGELAVVIGKAGYRISRADAMSHIFGYTIINDVTSRGLQKKHNQWFLGKNLDGFCPMGPAVVTTDEIPDITSLLLQTKVNGEIRQSAYISQLIFDIPNLIETISEIMTLNPGDLIATGTPAGVGVGFKPPRFLKPGDRVEIEIEPIGILSNPVE
jgi:2-keto-4-pentenoate hydratase/2-oxohepta-3-ene-1,7-dioic acid hydratase in catechol pathway